MKKAIALAATGLLVVLTAGLIILSQPAPIAAADAALKWEAVKAEVPVGKSRLEVRLTGASSPPATSSITVTSTRLDMGPDGMATMTAKLRPVTSTTAGVLAFEAELAMAGRWALTITANVEGQSRPVSGVVVFTAVNTKSEAPPSGERKIVYYRNPMGLPDVSTAPKKDSMGMDYIPVYADEVSAPDGTVRISLDKVQRAGVRTEAVVRRNLARSVQSVGTIVPDESRLAVVTAKFGGFVEELFVPLTGVDVRAGQPLMRVWIESPEILQKQADFLTALRGGPDRADDIERTARNLRLFGIPDPAIDRLRQTREPVRSIVLTAPSNGTVLEKAAIVGMRFGAGDRLFKTADLSTVWMMAQVAERDVALVRIGQRARITLKAYVDVPLEARVAFIYPEIDLPTRTARVRIELPNRNGLLRTGLYGDVTIDAQADGGPVIAVPTSAIIDSGTRRVAFVAKDDGVFEPRNLILGRRGNGYVEVREGLAENEKIVVSGNFLIDAESNLRAALATFTASEIQR